MSSVQLNLKEEIIIHPKDATAASTLDMEISNVSSNLQMLDPATWDVKSVVLRYPRDFALDLLEDHPKIIKAERRTPSLDKMATTKQVTITHLSPSPQSIVLSIWGKYQVHPFVLEPLKCYKVSAFQTSSEGVHTEGKVCNM